MKTIEEKAEEYFNSLVKPLADTKGLVITAFVTGAASVDEPDEFHCSECNGIDTHKKTCSEYYPEYPKPNTEEFNKQIFIDGDFNNSYESRVRGNHNDGFLGKYNTKCLELVECQGALEATQNKLDETKALNNAYAAKIERLEKSLKNQFCECSNEVKTGCTSAMHCNICGKLEQSETWLMHSPSVGGN